MRQEVPNAHVTVQRREELGYGVTLYEVIQVIADVRGAGGDLLVGALAQPLIKWMRERWQQDRDKHPDSKPRPRSIVFFDADRNKFRSITIDLPDGEPHEDKVGDTTRASDC